MMRTTLSLLCVCLCLLGMGQLDTTVAPVTVKYGWTDPPPPMNVVEAGIALEADGAQDQASWYALLGGALVGGVLMASGSEPAGWVVVGLGATLHVGLRWNAARKRKQAGRWLRQGWNEGSRYEALPDSVGPGVPVGRERMGR
jgi:hypothetical protein